VPQGSLIKDLKVKSENEYVLVPDGFTLGAKVFTDRSYELIEVPAELEGATYIKVPIVDRITTGNDHLTFSLYRSSACFRRL